MVTFLVIFLLLFSCWFLSYFSFVFCILSLSLCRPVLRSVAVNERDFLKYADEDNNGETVFFFYVFEWVRAKLFGIFDLFADTCLAIRILFI